jgi:hypothetical protein
VIKACALLIACSGAFTLAAQEESSRTVAPCISPSEEVHTWASDHIKPPLPLNTPKPERKPSRGQFSLELVINAEGAVCSARVIKVMNPNDQADAAEVAAFIPGHWTFKPATRKGHPVAFRFVTNFTAER